MNTCFYIPQETELQNLIHSFWQVDRFSSFHEEYIIPKGVVEIIFNFSDGGPVAVQLGNRQYHLSECFVNGFNTKPIQLRLPGHQVFFGVQLQPMAVKKILDTPAHQFADIPVDLTLLGASFQSLWHQLAAENNFKKRVAIFSKWVKNKTSGSQPQEKMINHFLGAINQHDLSVNELARSVCFSPRHLARKIFEATGMNTEEILLYKKYLHSVHLMHHTDMNLTQIAYQSNFSDQSHFIRSFKAFAEITPGEYSRSKGYIKGHIVKKSVKYNFLP